MTLLIVLLALAVLFLALCYGVYRFTFYNPIPRPQDPYEVPRGKQYQDCRELTLELIRAFLEQET